MKKNAHRLLERLVWSCRVSPTGEMGPQVQGRQGKYLKVNHLYVQTISLKTPGKLFMVD